MVAGADLKASGSRSSRAPAPLVLYGGSNASHYNLAKDLPSTPVGPSPAGSQGGSQPDEGVMRRAGSSTGSLVASWRSHGSNSGAAESPVASRDDLFSASSAMPYGALSLLNSSCMASSSFTVSRTAESADRPAPYQPRSVSSSPETPLASKNSLRSVKRSAEAAKASHVLNAALSGQSAPPPTLLHRSSSLRRRPSETSTSSLRPIPERQHSYPAMPASSLELGSSDMVRSSSEPDYAGTPLSYTPSTDSEAYTTSASASTRTSNSANGIFTGRMSSSSSFTNETDISSPASPNDKTLCEDADLVESPDGVGLGISADYAVNPHRAELESMRSRSRASYIVSDRPFGHSRFSSSASSIFSAAGDVVVRSPPDADVADLSVPANTSHLNLSNAGRGVEALLQRVLPIVAAHLVSLDLSCTGMHVLPPSLSACKRLRELNLSGNRLAGGALPLALLELPSLNKLVLDGCRLAHLSLSLAGLTELRTLSLRQNALCSLPSWLHHMDGLEVLLVDGNPFTPHWANLVQPLLDSTMLITTSTVVRNSLNTSLGGTSSESHEDSAIEGSSGTLTKPPSVKSPARNALPPPVTRSSLGLQKMRSMGELRSPYPSMTQAMDSTTTLSSTVLPPPPGLAGEPAAVDTVPALNRSPSANDIGTADLGRKKGFFGSMRMPSRDGRRPDVGEARSTSSPEPFRESGRPGATRFLSSGFKRVRTTSTTSSASTSTGSSVSPIMQRNTQTHPMANSVASMTSNSDSAPSRPETSLSGAYSSSRSDLHSLNSSLDEPSREVLDSNVSVPAPGADVKAGMRLLKAYLRDLDDLSPAEKGRAGTPRLSPSLAASPSLQSSPYSKDSMRPTIRTGAQPVSSPERISSATDLADIKLKDDAAKREKVIAEIVATEQSYVKGLLELVEIYVRPASEQTSDGPVVPASEKRAVFSNVEDILRFHASAFLPDLESAMLPLRQAREAAGEGNIDGALVQQVAEAIASVFIKHAAYLKMYSVYITGFDQALSRFQSWTAQSDSGSAKISASSKAAAAASSDPAAAQSQLTGSQRKRIKAYLKHCRANPKHTQMNCESYLLLPVQRIPRYKMLLESLLSCTPVVSLSSRSIAPHPQLLTAFELASNLANDLNERKRESEGRLKLLNWQNRIGATRFRSPLVQPHRVLLREGSMTLSRVVKRSNAYAEGLPPSLPTSPLDARPNLVQVPSLQIKSDGKALYALLCSDILVLVHDSGSPTGPVELYTVFRPQSGRGLPASNFGGEGMLRIVDSRAILYLKCASNEEAERWAAAINEKLSPQ